MTIDKIVRNLPCHSVDRCIYCDRTPKQIYPDMLHDEHIVPYSLGGTHKLPKSSCRKCGDITGALEGRCAHVLYRSLRIKRNFQTRHKKDRRDELPMTWKAHGEEREILVPSVAAIGIIPLFHLLPPSFLTRPGVKEKQDMDYIGSTFEAKNLPVDRRLWRNLPKGDLVAYQEFDRWSYARLMAKIAYVYCVCKLGLDSFDHNWLRPYILGDDPHLAHVVGGLPAALPPILAPSPVIYKMACRAYEITQGEWFVMAHIHLFVGDGNSPVLVVVGRTTEKMAHSPLLNYG